VGNLGATQAAITAAWLPHGRFRADRTEYDPPIVVGPGEEVLLTFEVAGQEAPGTEVENCFVILTLEADGLPWRAFARLTVRFGAAGRPDPRTEVITVNPVGA
jgi:hypothetical protein